MGYPLTGGNGNNKNTVTLRFPKFTKSATYDPVISASGSKLGAGYIILISIGGIIAVLGMFYALKYFGACGADKWHVDVKNTTEMRTKV